MFTVENEPKLNFQVKVGLPLGVETKKQKATTKLWLSQLKKKSKTAEKNLNNNLTVAATDL